MSEKSPFVVSADWLEERLGSPGLSIVDGSWYFPGRDARAEYDAAHIPGAVFFDQDLVVDPESDLPHALPDPLTFERHASSMGISKDDTIVVYDGPGFMSAPRVWWLFRIMGARKVFVLDGGFDKWRSEGRPVTREQTKIAPSAFVSEFDSNRVVLLEEMRGIVERREAQIADARASGRFNGTEPEPRPGLRGGHMPGAVNVPSSSTVSDPPLSKSPFTVKTASEENRAPPSISRSPFIVNSPPSRTAKLPSPILSPCANSMSCPDSVKRP